MPTPATQHANSVTVKKGIRNLLAATIPAPEGPQREHSNRDLVELAALATGRHLSLAATSRTRARLPDSDTFHHHLHATTPQQVYHAGIHCLENLLGIARTFGWLEEPVDVAVDRHNEPHYSKTSPFAVRMKNTRGTTRAHAYLTSQRLADPPLPLDIQLLTPFRGQHDALADLLQATQARQAVRCWYLDKAFYNHTDLRLLEETGCTYVVAAPKSKHLKRLEKELYRRRVRTGPRRWIATAPHRLGGRGGTDTTLVIRWEPDDDEPTGEAWFAYATNHDGPIADLARRTEGYRSRWGIETEYRSLEQLRLRTTTTHYANRLYLTLVALLLLAAWRILRHARRLRDPAAPPFTLPQFRIELATDPPEVAA